MRRLTLIGGALALLLTLGGVAIAGAAPKGKPADAKAKTLRFDVQFSPFHLVDVGQDGARASATTWSSTTSCWWTAGGSVTRAAPARWSTSRRA